MAILSLRATISALSALSVAVVAAITLSITLTTSLSALRNIGQTHATSLLTNAQLQTDALFHRTVIATETLGNVSRSKPWNFPSDDSSVAAMYRTVVLDQFLACEGYCNINAVFQDSSEFQVNNYNADIYSGYVLIPAPYSMGGAAYQLTQPVKLERFAGYWANHTSPPLTDPVFNQSISTFLIASSAGWKAQLNIYGKPQGISYGGVSSPPGLSGGFSVVMYSHTVTSDPTWVYGASAISVDITAVQSYLRGVAGTPHTALFAYDDGGFLIGVNLDTPFHTQFSINASYVAPPGCTSNQQFAAFGTGDLLGWCRTHISSYGYGPLAELALDHAKAFTVAQSVGMFSVDGSMYYYAVAKVYLKYPGMGVWLALIIPEGDVIGDVVSGRNTAIGVTCGVFVLVTSVTFAAIALLLRPLATIADRMMLAAGLEDDEADDVAARSAMSEVEDLQDAYAAMNAELNRIKSFVPKTVLRKTHRDAAADGDDDDLKTCASQRKSTNELDRGTVESSASRRSKKSSNIATHLECGLTPQTVTVVSGDMDGFDAAVQSTSRQGVVNQMSHTVQLVHDAAAAHKGVVQSFHGDHFVVTFNAVSPSAAHARRACSAALQIVANSKTLGMQLPVRTGVATGRCLVGNLGSQDAKGFNTIGPAFVQAGLLQRCARHYGPDGRVLATRRTCADIATHLKFLYVDIVALPTEATLVGAVLGAAVADTSQLVEWLYVVGGGGNANTVEDSVNEAFVSLWNGHHDAATTIVANQLSGVDLCDMNNGLRCQLVQRLKEAAAAPPS